MLTYGSSQHTLMVAWPTRIILVVSYIGPYPGWSVSYGLSSLTELLNESSSPLVEGTSSASSGSSGSSGSLSLSLELAPSSGLPPSRRPAAPTPLRPSAGAAVGFARDPARGRRVIDRLIRALNIEPGDLGHRTSWPPHRLELSLRSRRLSVKPTVEPSLDRLSEERKARGSRRQSCRVA